ncbi:MAG: ATP-binding protein [Phycisphaerales bacterium]
MKIGRKLISVILAVMVVFTATVLVQRYFETKRLYALFNERKEINALKFKQIVEMMNKKLETYVIEITYWDEIVKAVESKDIEWFKSSVETTILTGNDYSAIWVYNINKEMIFSTGAKEKGFEPDFAISSSKFDSLLENKIICHFFIETPKGIMEINGAKIYPGSDPARQTKPRGYVFAGKLWDGPYMTKISAITSDKICMYPYNEIFLKDKSDFKEGIISFIHVINSWDNKPISIVSGTSQYTQLKAISDAFAKDLFLFLIFAATLITFIMYFIIKWITNPLNLISETLKKENVSLIKGLLKDKSEFGDMAQIINQFFKQRTELNEKEERYRMIFDTANDSILLMQKDKFIDCNKKTLELFGCTREQIVDKAPYLYSPPIQPDGGDSTEKAMENILAAMTGKPQRFEWVHRRYDKSTFDADVSLNAFNSGGKDYIQAIVRDISERKKAEDEMKRLNNNLEEANSELRNFVYIASHDLREPLRKITAFGGILQKNLKGALNSEDAENLQFMIEGAQRMNRMIEGLLAYSKVSTTTHLPQNVDLNVIVSQLQDFELSLMLEEKGAIINVPQTLPHVEVDPVQILQLLQNLIANGMKYQKAGSKPEITIVSKPAPNGMVRIEISDNGIGIKPEYQQSVFIMFKRLHTNKEYEGHGIGLAVCKKIVERFGGKIGVESEFGKGSTFWFTLPAPCDIAEEALAEV